MGVLLGLCGPCGTSGEDSHPASAAVLTAGYPRACYFRQSEWAAANVNKGYTYPKWAQEFSVLGGVLGKVLNEESPDKDSPDQNGLTKLDYFNRLKAEYPEKLVLLHFNGNARLPTYFRENVFDGHWLYYEPVHVESNLSATPGEAVIHVNQIELFSLTEGKYKQNGTDVCLVRKATDGTPDWFHAEQVTVTAVDERTGTIRVKRGMYGTKVHKFDAGETFAFIHATEGPFGSKGKRPPLLWKYNYSVNAPKDASGRILADTLSNELAALFLHGELQKFDGVEFDALGKIPSPQGIFWKKKIHLDFNGDGKGDDGASTGASEYGMGVQKFYGNLRAALGPDRIIMADIGPRGFGILNGVEAEGFPRSAWYDFVLWSERLNKMRYWARNSASPAFNLVNGKFELGKDPTVSEVPMSAIRLQIAAACFSDSAYFTFYKPADADQVPVWDELVMGTEGIQGWLGYPVGDALWISESLPDVLQGQWRERLVPNPTTACSSEDGFTLSGTKGSDIGFLLKDISYENEALLVSVTARTEPLPDTPAASARLMMVANGQEVKTWKKQQLVLETYVGEKSFTSRFYFSKNRYETNEMKGSCDLQFTIEGSKPVYIENISVRNAPNVMYREFEYGLVLANPSDRVCSVDLAELFPGQKFIRLKGSPGQDQTVNDGRMENTKIDIPARDARFLIKQKF